jgi:hypothetical protein
MKGKSCPAISVGRSEAICTLRVFGSAKLVGGGVLYKSVVIGRTTTAAEVVGTVLERYGNPTKPWLCELRYVKVETTKKKRRMFRSKPKPISLVVSFSSHPFRCLHSIL